jgi:hypothetical protein
MWRRYRHTTRDPRARHLLLQPYDPSKGMVALSADDTGLGWFVAPDQVAAEVHGLSSYGALVGGSWHGSAGWQTTAFTHPRAPGHLPAPGLPAAAGRRRGRRLPGPAALVGAA